ncbi:uncharacterized protein LOC113005003 [Solenopsis invicta]|uniref:uncharacterized protein LOC113005003 n=1 Tax=Solenopsis invicta TaxID=13686 RepID=UPI00193D8054|nr:uncharacterized protein LOC113005003 [Solenopsis invicta]
METVRKRESWETEETRYFLQLMRERQVMKSLDGKRFRADDIFKHLELPMNEKGYNKTAKQMQTRFRTLRLQYNKIRRQMGKSGSGNYMSSFMYVEEMSQLLEFRPIAIGDVVDSTPLQDLSESNTNSESNIWIYEDAPDPRDGAIPGCSSDNNSTTTDPLLQEDSSSESNIANQSKVDSFTKVPTKRCKVRSHEVIALRDAPDPRDGAIPGCSSDNNSTTDPLLQEDSSSESNTANQSKVDSFTKVPTKRCNVRSREAIALRYADKLKENYEEVQNNTMEKNRCFIEKLMESEKQLEKELINNMLESQQKMLRDTTNQLLTGLQNIFAPQIPSQFSTVSVPTVHSAAQSPFVMSPIHYSSSFSNLESQTFRSSSPFPKVLVNG